LSPPQPATTAVINAVAQATLTIFFHDFIAFTFSFPIRFRLQKCFHLQKQIPGNSYKLFPHLQIKSPSCNHLLFII
jgi:hypothetical protein